MSIGELLTRATIWLALAGYTVGAAALLLSRRQPALRRTARWAWSFGCAWFLAHVFCAFNFYYRWSHEVAYLETARQSAQVTGSSSGHGIFVSYLFTLAWFADVAWWWLSPQSHARRPAFVAAIWHTFLFFIIFNGTVVFESGLARLAGLLISAVLLTSWLVARHAVVDSGHEFRSSEG